MTPPDPQIIDGIVYTSWEATAGPDAPSLGDIGRRIYEPPLGPLDAGDRRLRSE